MELYEIVDEIAKDYNLILKGATCFWSPTTFTIPDKEKTICLMEKKAGSLGTRTEVMLVFSESGLYSVGKKVLYSDFGKYLITDSGDFVGRNGMISFLSILAASFKTDKALQFVEMARRIQLRFCESDGSIAEDRKKTIAYFSDVLHKKVSSVGTRQKNFEANDYDVLVSQLNSKDGAWATKLMSFLLLKGYRSFTSEPETRVLERIKNAIEIQPEISEEAVISYALSNIGLPAITYDSDWLKLNYSSYGNFYDDKWNRARSKRDELLTAIKNNVSEQEYQKILVAAGVDSKDIARSQKAKIINNDAKMLEAYLSQNIDRLSINDRDSLGLDAVHYGIMFGDFQSVRQILKKNTDFCSDKYASGDLQTVYDYYFLARYLGYEDFAKEMIERSAENRRLFKEICALEARRAMLIGQIQIGEQANNFSDGVYDKAKKLSANLTDKQKSKLDDYKEQIGSSKANIGSLKADLRQVEKELVEKRADLERGKEQVSSSYEAKREKVNKCDDALVQLILRIYSESTVLQDLLASDESERDVYEIEGRIYFIPTEKAKMYVPSWSEWGKKYLQK